MTAASAWGGDVGLGTALVLFAASYASALVLALAASYVAAPVLRRIMGTSSFKVDAAALTAFRSHFL